MKKTLIILIILLLVSLVAFFGWYFLARDSETPLVETIGNILPFGSGDNTSVPVSPTGNEFENGTANNDNQSFDKFGSPNSPLFRISNTPVAGAVTFKRGAETIVRYVDRATGHIYDTDLVTLTKTKVTNQTLPKIYEAYFSSEGNSVLLRFLKDDSDVVENLALTLTPPQGTSTGPLYAVSSTPLRGNIGSVAVSAGNTLFYALRDSSSIVSSTFNGIGTKTLLVSPFTDWHLATAGNNLVLYTKASANISGFAYTLNTSSKAFTKILGPFNGLTVLPNASGNRVLYSYVENDQTRLFAKNLVKNTSTEILPVTLAEKCIWGVKKVGILFCGAPINEPGVGEPDGWYRGETHFSDRIWLFDTNIDIAQALAEPKMTLDVDIDLVEPRLSPDEDYLIFINKIDLSLWALRLD
ncbi:MAG: hypothetical protein Q7K26_03190 [bacterium]|nr:hypothetical protein [bacterium]